MKKDPTLVKSVTEQLGFLTLHFGFEEPIEIDDEEVWKTRVYLLEPDLAVEVEFDWRETHFAIMIVRLEKGELPNGYYISEATGNQCRSYLTSLVREEKCESDISILQSLKELPSDDESAERKARKILALEIQLLKSAIDSILRNKNNLFD